MLYLECFQHAVIVVHVASDDCHSLRSESLALVAGRVTCDCADSV